MFNKLAAICAFALALMCAGAFPSVAFADQVRSAELPVSIVAQDGRSPSPGERVRVVLEPLDPADPMPSGSEQGRFALDVPVGQTARIPSIAFDELGMHEYTVRQEPGSVADATYSSRVYRVRYAVVNGDSGVPMVVESVRLAGDAGKQEAIEFVNAYPAVDAEPKPDPDPAPTPGPLALLESVLPKTSDGIAALVGGASVAAVVAALVAVAVRRRARR